MSSFSLCIQNGFCSAQTLGELSCVTVSKVNTVLGGVALPQPGTVCQTKSIATWVSVCSWKCSYLSIKQSSTQCCE